MKARDQLLAIFTAAIEAVKPDQALARHARLEGEKLLADDAEYDVSAGAVRVLAAGKGAAPMARALEAMLGHRIAEGFAVVKYGHRLNVEKVEMAEAAHPVPDASGEKAAAHMLEVAGHCQPDDLLICLLTGGASALMAAPAPGLTLEDLQKATSLLLASGASIDEVNALRKHLSRASGGQLAKAANGARVLTFIVSDVVGDSLDAIASGPTAPDSSSFGQCLAIVEKYGLAEKMPKSVMTRLELGARGEVAETPKSDAPFFANVQNVIVANIGQALDAAAAKAEELGFRTERVTEPMGGEAAEQARELVKKAATLAIATRPGDADICLLAGGETTVTIKGEGLGGRNQEMALACALELEKLAPELGSRVSALFAGTDGTDGPTDAAGGFAFADSTARMNGHAEKALANNDSYHALQEAGDLLKTGPTLTNVMDLAILLIKASEA